MKITIQRPMATPAMLLAPAMLLSAALLLMLPVLAHAQGRVFLDDGASGAWAANGCPSVAVAADGGAPKAGTRMRQCNLGVQEMALNSWDYGAEFLVRYWFRYDANVDHKAGSKQMRIGFQSAFELLAACQFENGTAATLFVSVNGRSSFWGNRPTVAVCGDRQWHKLEIARRDNGPLRMWVDDQPVTGLPADWSNAGGHVGALYLPSNWSQNPGWEHDAINHVYFDDVEIYSDRGAGASGSIMEGTIGEGAAPHPPPTPINCTGVWAESLSEPTPLVCDATQQQTRTRTRTFTVTTVESNGGTCVQRGQSPIQTTETAPCVYVPPPPPPVPTLVGRFASQVTYTSGGVSGLRVTLRVSAAQAMPALGAAVTLRVPLANGASELRSGRVRSTRANAYSGGDGQIVVEMPGLNAIGLELQLPQ